MQPILYILTAVAVNGMPIAFHGRGGPFHVERGGAMVTASDILFKAVASRSTPDTLWSATSRKASADVENSTAGIPTSFLRVASTSTSIAPSSKFLNANFKIGSPANPLPSPLITLVTKSPTVIASDHEPQAGSFHLSCSDNTATATNNDQLMTEIYQFKLIATVLGSLYALVQLCETQVLSKTGHFLSSILKSIYTRGRKSSSNITSWLKKILHPSEGK
ncbi:hypothetical protein BDV97DRAFT_42542 [Delphinella strobiligena]|nr:hypothetical protein BDV97DRAFT_42542 [Delphinella strobiligena]